ncbi:hypothetical protein RBTH_09497 [Bacillus thuringiensis serovar israelensis ATCC 35646]|nr:hypothetical protein RBTH_09497 [Bacillus thuringiensis serovar israelensis ATCC 35646]
MVLIFHYDLILIVGFRCTPYTLPHSNSLQTSFQKLQTIYKNITTPIYLCLTIGVIILTHIDMFKNPYALSDQMLHLYH